MTQEANFLATNLEHQQTPRPPVKLKSFQIGCPYLFQSCLWSVKYIKSKQLSVEAKLKFCLFSDVLSTLKSVLYRSLITFEDIWRTSLSKKLHYFLVFFLPSLFTRIRNTSVSVTGFQTWNPEHLWSSNSFWSIQF